jgi:hypothetical protein
MIRPDSVVSGCGGGGGLHSFVRLVDERFCAVLFFMRAAPPDDFSDTA